MCVLIQRFHGCCLNICIVNSRFHLGRTCPTNSVRRWARRALWNLGWWQVVLEYCAPFAHISFNLRTLFISVILRVHHSWSFFIKLFPCGWHSDINSVHFSFYLSVTVYSIFLLSDCDFVFGSKMKSYVFNGDKI